MKNFDDINDFDLDKLADEVLLKLFANLQTLHNSQMPEDSAAAQGLRKSLASQGKSLQFEDLLSDVDLESLREIKMKQEFVTDSKMDLHDDAESDYDSFKRKFLSILIKKLNERSILNQFTFAFPSHPLMITLIGLFLGKNIRLPKKMLETPEYLRTPEERKRYEDYVNEFIEQQITGYDNDGKEQFRKVFNITDTVKVSVKAIVKDSLFSENDIIIDDQALHNLQSFFSLEGLRHFLGFIVALEERGRTGSFEWNVNEHLERLGYKRKANGAFDHELKKKATGMILLLDQLLIIAERKDGAKHHIKGEKLFSLVGFDIEKYRGDIINEKLVVRAEDFWYKSAFQVENGRSATYTKLLRQIAHENHWEHPLTIYLAPFLSIFWRMNRIKKFSVRSLMLWCNLPITGNHRMYNLRKLESELNYMRDSNYLGKWLCDDTEELPSKQGNPFDCVLTLYPPEWLDVELEKIETKRESFSAPKSEPEKLSAEQFTEIFNKTNLNVSEFCNKIGLSRRMFYYVKNGERELSPEFLIKIKEALPEYFS